MPRSNPGGCFIVPRNKYSEQTGEAATGKCVYVNSNNNNNNNSDNNSNNQ